MTIHECTGYNDCPCCGQDPYSPASDLHTVLLTVYEIHLVQRALDTKRSLRRKSAARALHRATIRTDHADQMSAAFHTELADEYDALLEKFRV